MDFVHLSAHHTLIEHIKSKDKNLIDLTWFSKEKLPNYLLNKTKHLLSYNWN